jgi:putative peptidoglycan lipid II flippase
VVLACLIMGAALAVAARALAPALAADGVRYAALALLVAIGFVSYGVAALGIGALRPADIRAALRRGAG